MSDFEDNLSQQLSSAESQTARAFASLTPISRGADLELIAFNAGSRKSRALLLRWQGAAAAMGALAIVLLALPPQNVSQPSVPPLAKSGTPVPEAPDDSTLPTTPTTPALAVVLPELPASSIPLAAIDRAGSAQRVRTTTNPTPLLGGF